MGHFCGISENVIFLEPARMSTTIGRQQGHLWGSFKNDSILSFADNPWLCPQLNLSKALKKDLKNAQTHSIHTEIYNANFISAGQKVLEIYCRKLKISWTIILLKYAKWKFRYFMLSFVHTKCFDFEISNH